MPSKRHYYDSSSDNSFQTASHSNRRRLPSPPSGILRNTNSRHVTIVDPANLTRRVDRIADNLEDTSRNLRSVDTKVTDFKDLHDDSMSALTKLQEDLEGSLHHLRSTRERRSYARGESLHQSDLHPKRSASLSRARSSPGRGFDGDAPEHLTRRSYRRPSSSLGFSRLNQGDGFSTSVRDQVHDLSSSQAKLEQDLNDEISRRMKSERSMRSLNESLKSATAADRVERRLKEIERGMAAERTSATQLASDVAGDLLRRSQTKLQEDDIANRSRFLQVESSKRAIENELEVTRRRLEQSEGGREALMTQIGELRSLINRSDKERAELNRRVEQHEIERKVKLEKETENHHRLALSERQERERLRQENEIEELRAALKRSAGVVQLDETRRELEKSERQRQHLSDHIEVLTKDLEKKDQAQARVLNQHHDLQRAFDDSEREKDRLYGQLEDALRKLKELTRDADKYTQDLRSVEQAKIDCEREKEELRSTAQETVRQWKTKCRKQEKEIERLQDNVEQITSKNEEILKESISSKTQANNAFQQAENLRKEMEDLIAKRVKMDEKLRQRDNELEQISDDKKVLLKQLKDAVAATDSRESKIRESLDKLSSANQRVSKYEKELESLTSLYETAKKQTTELQYELRELKLRNSELDSRLLSESRERKEAEKLNEESTKQVQAMKIEVNAVHKQLQIERETHKKELKDLHSDIHAGEVERMDAVQKVSRKADEERGFLEGEIHRVNMEANAAKAATRESEKLLLKAKEELNLLERDVNRLETESKAWREKYQIIKSTYENKCGEVSRESSRAKKVEDDLLWSRDHVRRLQQLIESANDLLSQDISELEHILELNSDDSLLRSSLSDTLDRTSISKGDGWVAVLRRKLDCVKKEVKIKMEHRRKALDELSSQKQQMKELCRSMEDDRRHLMGEVTEQNKLVDSLSKEKTSLLLENKEARMIVHDLEDRVAYLTADLESSKARLQENFSEACRVAVFDVEESLKERQRIQERYTKYKETMDSLQAELEESRSRSKHRSPLRLGAERSPSPIKRVTISDTSPIIHGYSSVRPRSSSPKYLPEKDR